MLYSGSVAIQGGASVINNNATQQTLKNSGEMTDLQAVIILLILFIAMIPLIMCISKDVKEWFNNR